MKNKAIVCANLRREFMVPPAFEFEGESEEALRAEAQNFFDTNIKPGAEAAERRATATAPTSYVQPHRGDIRAETVTDWGAATRTDGFTGDGLSKLARMPR